MLKRVYWIQKIFDTTEIYECCSLGLLTIPAVFIFKYLSIAYKSLQNLDEGMPPLALA